MDELGEKITLFTRTQSENMQEGINAIIRESSSERLEFICPLLDFSPFLENIIEVCISTDECCLECFERLSYSWNLILQYAGSSMKIIEKGSHFLADSGKFWRKLILYPRSELTISGFDRIGSLHEFTLQIVSKGFASGEHITRSLYEDDIFPNFVFELSGSCLSM